MYLKDCPGNRSRRNHKALRSGLATLAELSNHSSFHYGIASRRVTIPGLALSALCFLCVLPARFPAAAAIVTNVSYGSFFFNPRVVSIHVGDTVVWTNGFGSHTVLGTGSDPMCGGAFLPCSHKFNTAGTYLYECTVLGHAAQGMTGVVNVASAPPTVTPALITNATRLADGQFQFTIISSANQATTIQAATDLSSTNSWVSLGTITTNAKSFTFTDTNAGGMALRFYRVVGTP